MANIPTDKFNTTTFITNNAPINYGWAGSKVTLNANGQNLGAIPVDPTTNQAVYQTTVGSQGVQTLGMTFTGGKGYAGGASDSYTSHVGGSAVSQQSVVTQIVAGPGIYISAPNGQGIVTISTTPIPAQINTNALLDVTWTQTYDVPGGGDNSQFTAVGLNGVNKRSRDGSNFIQMALPSGTVINAAISEQSASIPDGGVDYSGINIYGQSIYGRLGSSSGDGMITISNLTSLNTSTINIINTFAFRNGGAYTDSMPSVVSTDYQSTGGSSGSSSTYYILLEYLATDGLDIDTQTYISSPNVGENQTQYSVGYGLNDSLPTSGTPYLFFGGDNTGVGQEAAYLDVAVFKAINPSATSITISCNAYWYNTVGTNPVPIKATIYKGGTMNSNSNYSWNNTSAISSSSQTSAGVVVTAYFQDSTQPGQHITNFTYNFSTNTGSFS